MFKENKEFWLYIIGSIIMMVLIMFGLRDQFGTVNLTNFGFSNTNNGGVTETVQPTSEFEPDRDYRALISTNKGDFTIDLFETAAPNAVNNFAYLSGEDYYDGTTFHRLVPEVLLQGGSGSTKNDDPEDDKFGGPGYVIGDEINWDALDFEQSLRDKLQQEGYVSTPRLASKRIAKYRVAMASVGPNTSGSQFFIVLGEREDEQVDALRGRHTVFGEVIQNTELIDQLGAISVDNPLSQDPRPLDDIVITDIQILVSD